MAVNNIHEKTHDLAKYKETVALLKSISPNAPEAVPDVEWITKTETYIRAGIERLEGELRMYKTNLIKESIRVRYFIIIILFYLSFSK